MYLVDTNVWLERLLDQERAETVGHLLDHVPSEKLFITNFSFHSIGIILNRLKKTQLLFDFVQDLFINGAVGTIHLAPQDTQMIINSMEKTGLDFDDAYKYVAAEKYNLILVSFDSDFDKTERGKKTPEEISSLA